MKVSHEYKTLDTIDEHSVHIGAKARRLAVLKRLGIPVPQAVVMSEAIAAEHQGDTDWFAEVMQELHFPVIVRSSANIEDSELASFAGQFISKGPIAYVADVISAVDEVIAHKSSSILHSYLSHYNIADADVSVHVVIQEYVQPHVSGVVFTGSEPSPATHTIEYTKGGEGVTAGNQQVNRILVSAKTGAIKNHESLEDQLSEDVVSELVGHVQTIVQHFREPQDIEWVYDGQRVYIVQTRPITITPQSNEAMVQQEQERLQNMLGDTIPELSAHEFSEGVGRATPLTVSIFQKIYAKGGPWESVMRKYGYVLPEYDVATLVVPVFGRLYLNKEVEHTLLHKKLPFIYDSNTERRTWSTSPLRYIRTLFSFSRYLIGSLRLKFATYLFMKKKEVLYTRLQEKIQARNMYEHSSVTDHLAVITEDILPLLFKISMYQKYAQGRIESMVAKHLSDTEMTTLLQSGVMDSITAVLHDESMTSDEKKEKLAVRGYHELEVSSSRFRDNDILLSSLVTQEPVSVTNPATIELREKVVSGFQSVLDQQSLSTHLEIHDALAQLREDIHAVWAQEVSRLHDTLLHIDHTKKLYNHIWYHTLDELVTYSVQNTTLAQRRIHYAATKHVSVSAHMDGGKWDGIGVSSKQHVSGTVLSGTGIVEGVAKGVVGSLTDITGGAQIDILVTTDLDPVLTTVYSNIQGIVTEVGGSLSHAAIIAREYGIPIVVLDDASKILEQGGMVMVNGTTGQVSVLNI